MKKIAALWVVKDKQTRQPKKDKNGNTYFSGTWGDERILGFLNRPKEKETHPDIQIYIPDDEGQQPQKTDTGSGNDDIIPF